MKEHPVAESVVHKEAGSLESKERRSIVDRGHGEKLSRLMDSAIVALLESRTIKEAAGKIGIAESTLRSWYRDPGFRPHYDAARRHILEAGTMEIADLKLEGLAVLRDELNDRDNPKIRHDAAKFMVTLADMELKRLDAERRFRASQDKRADRQRGDFEDLEHSGMTVGDSLDLASAVREGDPEAPGQDTPPAAEAATSAQIGADHRHRDDDGKQTVRHGGHRDSRERRTSAQVIAEKSKAGGSDIRDDGRPRIKADERTDRSTRNPRRSAKIDADTRKTDPAHPLADSTAREHTENEYQPTPAMIRRQPVDPTAAVDVSQARERGQKPAQNEVAVLPKEKEEDSTDDEATKAALEEKRLLREQVQRERYW